METPQAPETPTYADNLNKLGEAMNKAGDEVGDDRMLDAYMAADDYAEGHDRLADNSHTQHLDGAGKKLFALASQEKQSHADRVTTDGAYDRSLKKITTGVRSKIDDEIDERKNDSYAFWSGEEEPTGPKDGGDIPKDGGDSPTEPKIPEEPKPRQPTKPDSPKPPAPAPAAASVDIPDSKNDSSEKTGSGDETIERSPYEVSEEDAQIFRAAVNGVIKNLQTKLFGGVIPEDRLNYDETRSDRGATVEFDANDWKAQMAILKGVDTIISSASPQHDVQYPLFYQQEAYGDRDENLRDEILHTISRIVGDDVEARLNSSEQKDVEVSLTDNDKKALGLDEGTPDTVRGLTRSVIIPISGQGMLRVYEAEIPNTVVQGDTTRERMLRFVQFGWTTQENIQQESAGAIEDKITPEQPSESAGVLPKRATPRRNPEVTRQSQNRRTI